MAAINDIAVAARRPSAVAGGVVAGMLAVVAIVLSTTILFSTPAAAQSPIDSPVIRDASVIRGSPVIRDAPVIRDSPALRPARAGPTVSVGAEQTDQPARLAKPGQSAQLDSFDPGVWPTLAAVVPGVLFHGAGLWAAGALAAGWTLARNGGAGMVVGALSVLAVYATGASRRTIAQIYYPGLVGLSGLVMPWFADIYGSAVGGRAGGPRLDLPPIEVRAGVAYINQDVFDYASFGYLSADLRLEPIHVKPSAWIAADDDNQRLRLEVTGRLVGPRAGRPDRSEHRQTRRDGSFLDLETAATYHRFGTDRFETLVLEAQLAGRYDMRRISPVLGGSFFELALGIGAQLFGYHIPGADLGEDVAGLLLMRTAYGVYFGPANGRYGEVKVYYNHRHDDFTAGIGLGSANDGLFGHIGARGFYYFSKRWGAFGTVEVGSAYLGVGGIAFRYGAN